MSVVKRTPILQMKSVSFDYPARLTEQSHTLTDISFDLFPGETLGLIGRNGSGKSTVLRLLAGIMNPESGQLIKSPEVKVGLLSLGVGFMSDLTGADNVVITLMLQGMTESGARALLAEIEAFSELGEAFYRPVKTYSAGMKSRLTFSAALHSHNDILLVDEVLAVGDAAFKRKARAAMTERILSDQTVVYVSHTAATVKQLCDRVVWIDEGRVKMCGAPADVLSAYKASQT